MHKSCVNCVNKFNCETFKLIINEGSDVDLFEFYAIHCNQYIAYISLIYEKDK